MPDQPSISLRKYIKWGDNPPSEPTSTLVLTSPLKNFVDIRVSRPTSSMSAHIITSLSSLEWAFGGTSSNTPATNSAPAHTIWKHWVDSQCSNLDADQVRDEGDMIVQENGEVLEVGRMVNPATGKEESYEECWIDVDLQAEDNVGWVIRVQNEVEGVRGVVIRVGAWIQGVLRRDGEFALRMWKHDASKNEGGSKRWNVLVRIGDLEVPERLFEDVKVEVGETIGGKDGIWDCVESWG
ncbi:hypothetical protein V8E51_003908 [Hyaloscypha variabilis]